MAYEFDWSSIPGSLPFLAEGMLVSLEITAVALVVGMVWGTVLALMRLSPVAPLRWFATGYINLFRSVPLVMVLLWFFLIVPQLFTQLFNLSPATDLRLTSAMVGFALFESAYYAEIIRAGIQSVPKGQLAGRVLLVDDLADSGVTLRAVVDRLRAMPAIEELRSAVIWVKGVSSYTPEYYVDTLPTSPWIHQPFEAYDSMRPEAIRKRHQG